MDQGALEPRPEPAVGGEELPAVERLPRMLRVRLWQAVAGMSLAVAIASILVVKDLGESLARRTNYVNRRVAALNASVRTLRRQTAVEQKKLGSERERATAGEMFEKFFLRPTFVSSGWARQSKRKRKGKRKIDRAGPNRRPALRHACDERIESSGDARGEWHEANRHLPGLSDLVDAETRHTGWRAISWSATTVARRPRSTCRRDARRKCN